MVYRLTYFDRPHFEKSAHQRSKMGPSRSVFCSSPPPGGIFEFFLNCIRFCSKFCTTYAQNKYQSFQTFLIIFEKTTKLKIFKNPCIDKNGNFSSSDWSISSSDWPVIGLPHFHMDYPTPGSLVFMVRWLSLIHLNRQSRFLLLNRIHQFKP